MKNYKTFFTIAVLLLVPVMVWIFLVSSLQSNTDKLAIYNPVDINPKLVNEDLRKIKKGHTVADFELTNQNGEIIAQEVYKDKIYVVDFFFSKCPTICPIMFNNMAKIQEEFLEDENIMLLSISVTPELDSVSSLRAYANAKGVIDAKWNVTTGDKKHIYELARKSYFAVTDEGDGGLQDFIHTSNFILVDENKQIRGIYDGVVEEEIGRLIEDVKKLREF